jgi:phosphate transport system substrate-binding protein
MNKFYIPCVFFLALFFSCTEEKNKQAATYGKLIFGAEEGIQYIAASEASVFSYFYKEATITPAFGKETQLIEDFINNKYPLIVCYRDFTEKEKKLLKDRNVVPYSTIIGLEGLALITAADNSDTAITISDLKTILTGKGDSIASLQKKWKNVVFDGEGTGNFRFVDSMIQHQPLSPYCFTKKSPEECIDFVSKNPNTVGIISFGLLADKNDVRVKEVRKKIKILAVSEDNKKYFVPSQYSFFNFDYPLIRKIYMHCRDADGSLAMGFISYVSSEEGQLVIKQGGLMPARLAWNNMHVVFEPMKIK